jgi:2-polyprenyl-3-methyl-5-hydroxy-6-metoxy-1,4-benzoquinol methylase
MPKTDWNQYYASPYKTASMTRKITTLYLQKLIRHSTNIQNPSVIEIGGGNSCFFESLQAAFAPISYTVIDNNQISLDKFCERVDRYRNVHTVNNDILNPTYHQLADVVFSVGLIEHFNQSNTGIAIQNHFHFVRENGIVILSFPTPTFLYRMTRQLSEWSGLWIFHDERPLEFEEVLKTSLKFGKLVEKKIIWPILLTQGMVALQQFNL